MATELENRCPICLDSWEEASFVMPCLHQFCYSCILRWADSKPECPLCKRGILSILHSVRADDDYVEHVITPSVTPSVTVRQAGGAPRHRTTHDLRHPGAPQQWAAAGLPRHPVGSLQPPNWMNHFRNQPTLLQTLQSWVHQEMEEIFGNTVLEAAMMEDTVTGNRGMDTELPGRMLGDSLQNRTAAFVQQRAHVAVQRRSREAHRQLGQWDARAAGGWEGSPAGAPSPAASQGGSLAPGPAPSSSPAGANKEKRPSTSTAALRGGPSSPPDAPVPTYREQEERHEGPGEAVAGPSTPSHSRDRSPGGARRPPKRRAGSSQDSSQPRKRPPRRQN